MYDLKNITFKQFVDNCEALKYQYQRNLTPFFNVPMIRCWKTMIYSLNMELWKRDRLWEVLNDDFSIIEFKALYKDISD